VNQPEPPPADRSPEWSADGSTLVYLLRHAETQWSASGRHTGYTDVPLTPEGERGAARLGALLDGLRGPDAPPPIVLSSSRQRAMRTAELAGLGTPIVLNELAEWGYGDYEGLTTSQIRESVPGWTLWTHPCPGGETAQQVSARADRVLASVAELGTEGDVVIVGHGHFSRALTARWIGLPPTSGVHFALDSGCMTVLGNERGVPRLNHVNLAPPDQPVG
jgi:broad specificity phosphatase PhoE